MTSEVVGGGSTDSPSVDSEACTVALDAFSGPLDLLLYLVRRAEVDIIDIPVASIADQFVAAVDAWAEVDLDVAGDFILMAASLLELKARMVAPPLEDATADEAEEEVIDLRAGLVGKLLAYRRCKEAALALERLEERHRPRLARQLHEAIPDDPDEEGIDLENADPYALAASFEAVMARIHGLGPRTVVADPLPLEAAISLLIETLQAQGEERLSELLATQPTRLGRVTVLMALLECARQRLIEVVQPEQYGDVRLRFRAAPERDAVAMLPPPEPEGPKRRKRPPLMTWAGVISDAEHDAAAPEEPLESDEQRFMRELEETCALEAALARAADIDGSFAKFWAERRGLPWPPPPEPVVPAPAAPVAAPPLPAARRERQRPAPAESPGSAASGALPARALSDAEIATAPTPTPTPSQTPITSPTQAASTDSGVVIPDAGPAPQAALAPATLSPATGPGEVAAIIGASPSSVVEPITTADAAASATADAPASASATGEARAGEPAAFAAGTAVADAGNGAAPVEIATAQPLMDRQPQAAPEPAPSPTSPTSPTSPADAAPTLVQAMDASRDEGVVVEVAGSHAAEEVAPARVASEPNASPIEPAPHAAAAAPVEDAIAPSQPMNAPSADGAPLAELAEPAPANASRALLPMPRPASPSPDALVDALAAAEAPAAAAIEARASEPAATPPCAEADEPTMPTMPETGAIIVAHSEHRDVEHADEHADAHMDAPLRDAAPAPAPMHGDAPQPPAASLTAPSSPALRPAEPAPAPIAARPQADPPPSAPAAAPTMPPAPLAASAARREPAEASAGAPAQSPLSEVIRQARAAAPLAPAASAAESAAPTPPAAAKRPAVRTEVLGVESSRASSLPSTRTRGTTLHPFPAPLRGATRPWRARAAFSATLLVLAGGWWMYSHRHESAPSPVEAPPEVMRLPLAGPAAMGPATPPLDVRALQRLLPLARLLGDGLAPLFILPAQPTQHTAPAPAPAPATEQATQLLQDLRIRACAIAAWFARAFPEPTRAAPTAPAPLPIAFTPPAATPIPTPARASTQDETASAALAADAIAAFTLDPAARAALLASAEAAYTPLEPASDPARAYPWLGDGMTSTSAWLMLHDARDLP